MPKRLHPFLLAAMLLIAASAQALTADAAKAIAVGDSESRIAALRASVADADAKTTQLIQALVDDAVKVVAGVPVIVQDDKAIDPVSGAVSALPDTAEDVMNNNRMRGELDVALALLKLASPDAVIRSEAIKGLLGRANESMLPLLDKAFSAETQADLKETLAMLRAAAMMDSPDKAKRLAAATLLGESGRAATWSRAWPGATSWVSSSVASAWAASCSW
jgi:urea transport system permease protein